MLRFFGILTTGFIGFYIIDEVICGNDVNFTTGTVKFMLIASAFFTLISYLQEIVEKLDALKAARYDCEDYE